MSNTLRYDAACADVSFWTITAIYLESRGILTAILTPENAFGALSARPKVDNVREILIKRVNSR